MIVLHQKLMYWAIYPTVWNELDNKSMFSVLFNEFRSSIKSLGLGNHWYHMKYFFLEGTLILMANANSLD